MTDTAATIFEDADKEISELGNKLNSLITVSDLLSRLIKLRAISIVLHVKAIHQFKLGSSNEPKKETSPIFKFL